MKQKTDILSLISRYRTEIMGTASIWILLFHEWRSILGSGPLGKAERFITSMGFYGVDFFFFLSGIGLVYAIGKYSTAQFYRRRFTRILVPFVVTVVLLSLFQGWTLETFFKTLSGYHFWMTDIYFTLWFFYAIMTLYLLFPLYYSILRRAAHPCVFTAGILLIWLFASNALDGILRIDFYGFTNRIPIFITGVLVGNLIKKGRSITLSGFGWAICFAVLFAGFALYSRVKKGMFLFVPVSDCFFPDYLITISGVCLLSRLFLFLQSGKPGQWFLQSLRFMGSISLELYCIQDIVLCRLQPFFAVYCGDVLANIFNFAVIIFSAWILHHFCNIFYKLLKFQ